MRSMEIFRRFGCAMLLAGSVAACGRGEAPAPPVVGADAGEEPELTPTEKQEKALANPLHVAHMDAEEDPTECKDCHRIEGKEPPTRNVKHRCLGCHEDSRSTVHAGVKDPSARECLSCHEFFEPEVDPWACNDCHAGGSPEASRPSSIRREMVEELADEAGPAAVHDTDCQACHAPHGEDLPSPGVDPESCLDCHADATRDITSASKAHHASAEGGESLGDPAQCLECHGGHERAYAARRSCVECHQMGRTATFEGHDRCVDCHSPHGRYGKRSCASCHDDQVTLAADSAKEHDRCMSCHRPHTVVRSPLQRCDRCHDDQAIHARSHPADEEKGSCVGCHPQHPEPSGWLGKVTDCARCHEDASTDLAFHVGVACDSCHQAHQFDLTRTKEELCSECHVEPAPRREAMEVAPDLEKKDPAMVAPVEGHQDCLECHEKGNHEPAAEPAACGSCHEEQLTGVSKGHDDCQSCHLPHEGTVEKTCFDCHEMKVAIGRHAPQLRECADCHGNHDASPIRAKSDCESCHDEALPLMHAAEGHETCGDCHEFHDIGRGGERKTCLTAGCHDGMDDHEPQATKCIGCHPFEKAPKEVWR